MPKNGRRGRALFNNAVPILMPPTARDMILTREFNSTIDKSDSTGQNNTNRVLATLIRGCYLCDVWDTAKNSTGYTYYDPKAASTIHRIYVTRRLYTRKTGCSAWRRHLLTIWLWFYGWQSIHPCRYEAVVTGVWVHPCYKAKPSGKK